MLRQQVTQSQRHSVRIEKTEEGLPYVTLHLNTNKLDGDVKMKQC